MKPQPRAYCCSLPTFPELLRDRPHVRLARWTPPVLQDDLLAHPITPLIVSSESYFSEAVHHTEKPSVLFPWCCHFLTRSIHYLFSSCGSVFSNTARRCAPPRQLPADRSESLAKILSAVINSKKHDATFNSERDVAPSMNFLRPSSANILTT